MFNLSKVRRKSVATVKGKVLKQSKKTEHNISNISPIFSRWVPLKRVRELKLRYGAVSITGSPDALYVEFI